MFPYFLHCTIFHLFQWIAGCSPFGSFCPSRSLIPTQEDELLLKPSPSHLCRKTEIQPNVRGAGIQLIGGRMSEVQLQYPFQPLAPPLCLETAILRWEAIINHLSFCQSHTCMHVPFPGFGHGPKIESLSDTYSDSICFHYFCTSHHIKVSNSRPSRSRWLDTINKNLKRGKTMIWQQLNNIFT